ERYEFRCDTKFECCGNICCSQGERWAMWLMFIFIALAMLVLFVFGGRKKPETLNDTSNSKVAYSSVAVEGKSSSEGSDGYSELFVYESGQMISMQS
ncbi:hypothetical protein PMAYCL1PPCAC_03490, partial [Pristionchus mayeri]